MPTLQCFAVSRCARPVAGGGLATTAVGQTPVTRRWTSCHHAAAAVPAAAAAAPCADRRTTDVPRFLSPAGARQTAQDEALIHGCLVHLHEVPFLTRGGSEMQRSLSLLP